MASASQVSIDIRPLEDANDLFAIQHVNSIVKSTITALGKGRGKIVIEICLEDGVRDLSKEVDKDDTESDDLNLHLIYNENKIKHYKNAATELTLKFTIPEDGLWFRNQQEIMEGGENKEGSRDTNTSNPSEHAQDLTGGSKSSTSSTSGGYINSSKSPTTQTTGIILGKP